MGVKIAFLGGFLGIMRFSDSFLDELRNRLSPSEIIGRRVALKSTGRGEHTGLCPFHKEKTPSFTVSDPKGFYHCFGCGAHGDIIKFTMENQGLSFVDSVKQLAGEAGMALPIESPEESARYDHMEELYKVLEAACSWFEAQLAAEIGTPAREYLERRGLTPQDNSVFRLGYASDTRNGLKDALLARGFSEAIIEAAGLIIRPEDEGQPYDRFRGRVIFPIIDQKNRVIAFGGRILGEGQPKYLNSPETDAFKKSYVLYGWNLARERAYKKGTIAVVEGYMDVIALHKAGIINVVAPLGTALTEGHIRILWKVAKEPVLCLDGDAAGKRAMFRAAEHFFPLLKPGLSMRFATLPPGEDPDDVIKTRGVDAIRTILAEAKPLADIIWDYHLGTTSPSTPEQKAAFEHALMQQVGKVSDATVQRYYRTHFKERLWQEQRQNTKETPPQKRITPIEKNLPANDNEAVRYEFLLIKLILAQPGLLADHDIEETFCHLEFTQKTTATLQQAICHQPQEENTLLTSARLREILKNQDMIAHIEAIDQYKHAKNTARDGLDLATAKSEWRYLLACHQLISVQKEYAEAHHAFETNISEDTQNRMLALKEQVEHLQKQVLHEKREHEALTEGV